MANLTKLKDFSGVPIFVTTEGKFTARVGQADMTRQNLRDLEREITKTFSGARAILMNPWSSGQTREVVVIGRERDGQWRLNDRTLTHSYVYRFDESAFDALCDIDQRREEEARRHSEALQALFEEQTAILKSLKEFTQSDFVAGKMAVKEGD